MACDDPLCPGWGVYNGDEIQKCDDCAREPWGFPDDQAAVEAALKVTPNHGWSARLEQGDTEQGGTWQAFKIIPVAPGLTLEHAVSLAELTFQAARIARARGPRGEA